MARERERRCCYTLSRSVATELDSIWEDRQRSLTAISVFGYRREGISSSSLPRFSTDFFSLSSLSPASAKIEETSQSVSGTCTHRERIISSAAGKRIEEDLEERRRAADH